MSAPISLTRVRLPQRRKELLRRLRLLEVLHRNIQRKLTFISAPAGYGKTALLLDFADDVDALVCWYSVAPDHGDLITFARHLIAAFQQQFPEFGNQLDIDQSASDPAALAVAVSNDMVTYVTDFCLMMIDDFHLVGEVQSIVNFVEALVEHLPDHVRFHIASRNVYGVPTITLVPEQEMTVIGQKELRFRADEIQALVKQNQHITLPYEQAAHLAEVADGWILALQLGARSLQIGAAPHLEGALDDIYAFLLHEVLDQQSPELKTLILATSIVDEFDEALANHLLESNSAAEQLRRLPERNLFVTKIETKQGTSYRYHQLFSEFLRAHVLATDPAGARALHYRAAQWYEALEQWELAVRHYLDGNDYTSAARIMDYRALQVYTNGQVQAIVKWTDTLANHAELLAEAPRLALSRAKILIDQGGSTDRVEYLLDIAEAGLRRQGDTVQLANALVTRGMFERFRSNFSEALALAQQVLNLLAEEKGHRWLQAVRLQGICLGQQGKYEAAAQALETAAAGFRASEELHDLAEALRDLSVTYFQMGNIYRVQQAINETVQIRRKTGGDRLCGALGNLGFLHQVTGRYREAYELYTEALQIAETAKYARTFANILNSQGNLFRDLEILDLAQTTHEKALQAAESTNGHEELVAEACEGLMDVERRRSNFPQALHWLREAARHRRQTETAPTYQFGLGLIYLSMEQYDLAEQAITTAVNGWQTLPRATEGLTLAEFSLAQVAILRKKRKRALEYLQRSLSHAAQLGYDQFLVVAARHAQTVLDTVREEDLTSGRAQWRSITERVVRFRPGWAALKDEPVEISPTTQTHIELFGFKGGQVLRDGELISNSKWTSVRSRALFYFLCHRKRVSRDTIALEFWPEFSQAQVTSNFHATLWRVRHAVGQDAIARDGDFYTLSESVSFWCDADEFEAHIKQATTRGVSDEERAEHWRQAAMLYQGPYLEGIDMPWASERRNSLHQAYRLAILGLGRWELARHRHETAQGWFERATADDDLDGEAAFGLLSCLIRSGELGKARAYFSAYKRRLADELGEELPQNILELQESLRF